MRSQDSYYRVASGVSVVPLPDGKVLLRTETAAVRLEGESAVFFVERVLPLLNGRRALADISASLKEISSEDLRRHLDQLVDKGVLRRGKLSSGQGDDTHPSHVLGFLEDLGVAPAETRERLRRLSAAVVGLEGHGAHLAWNLASAGIGNLVLVDPYPCQPGNLDLIPALSADTVGRPRQEVLRAAMSPASGTSITTWGSGAVRREDIQRLAGEVQIIVGCFDKGFSATNVWINEASLGRGIAAVYAELRGPIARLGPLVFPGQTACYMCWRMRALACENDFEEAMAYEEFLDRQQRPELHQRSMLPFLPAYVGSVLGAQILTSMLEVSIPTLAGKIFEFNGLTLRGELHTVLQRPDCPACKKKAQPIPTSAESPRLTIDSPGDIRAAASSLVSPLCGIVRDFRQMPKDVTEPAAPYVFRAQLANHRFVKEKGDELIAAGKGMTLQEAMSSALGEAVERYSAACWDHRQVLFARRGELDGESVDPRALVLYRPEQYTELPYTPYSEKTRLGWLQARSLVTDHLVFVPALAVSMVHQVRSKEEYLFGPTSNGLAAGPTRADATLSAILEVMERDAFVITWSNRLACLSIDPGTHPDEDVRDLYRSYLRRDVALHIARLPVDHPVHVMLAFAMDCESREPAVVVGLGADLSPSVAARKAVLEVGQVRPALRMRLRDPKTRARLADLVENPHRTSALNDHDLLYASPAMAAAFEFLNTGHATAFDWDTDAEGKDIPTSTSERLGRILNSFRSVGSDVLVYDLSPRDMMALGLHTVRAIIPGFQPIDFGWKERRLGGSRLFELPFRLGLRSEPTTVETLNRLPHPLA
jgi:ribosomal protein S12 methylthiotransferase accessory factor